MIPAAGSGSRMGAGHNKLFLKIGDKSILRHTADVFLEDPDCEKLILAVRPDEQAEIERELDIAGQTKPVVFTAGGGERQDSVAACIAAYEGDGIVLVHDAARPFIDRSVISELVRTAAEKGAAIAAVKAKDTVKLAENGMVLETLNRENLWMVQTPQAFRYAVLKEASDSAVRDGFLGTDESMLAERAGYPVHIVEGSYDNVKMTTQEDLAVGEILLKRRR